LLLLLLLVPLLLLLAVWCGAVCSAASPAAAAAAAAHAAQHSLLVVAKHALHQHSVCSQQRRIINTHSHGAIKVSEVAAKRQVPGAAGTGMAAHMHGLPLHL
jgi:hypothetical protein